MMGCGIAHFGRRGLETTLSGNIWFKILFPGVWTRGATRHGAWGLDSRRKGFGLEAPGGFSGTASKNPLRRQSNPPGNKILDQILSV